MSTFFLPLALPSSRTCTNPQDMRNNTSPKSKPRGYIAFGSKETLERGCLEIVPSPGIRLAQLQGKKRAQRKFTSVCLFSRRETNPDHIWLQSGCCEHTPLWNDEVVASSVRSDALEVLASTASRKSNSGAPSAVVYPPPPTPPSPQKTQKQPTASSPSRRK